MVLETIQVDSLATIIGLVSFAGGITAQYFRNKIEQQKMFSNMSADQERKLADLERQTEQRRVDLEKKLIGDISEIRVKVELFWRMVADNVPKLLMEPTARERDALLNKWRMGIITRDEVLTLKDALYEMIDQVKDDENRTAEDKMKAFLAVIFLPQVEYRLHQMERA